LARGRSRRPEGSISLQWNPPLHIFLVKALKAQRAECRELRSEDAHKRITTYWASHTNHVRITITITTIIIMKTRTQHQPVVVERHATAMH
jgi:hypothetical protein